MTAEVSVGDELRLAQKEIAVLKLRLEAAERERDVTNELCKRTEDVASNAIDEKKQLESKLTRCSADLEESRRLRKADTDLLAKEKAFLESKHAADLEALSELRKSRIRKATLDSALSTIATLKSENAALHSSLKTATERLVSIESAVNMKPKQRKAKK